MISESVASLFSVCEIAIINAIGAMTSTSAGITRLVMPRNVLMVCPWLVIKSMPRSACVIQITPVRLTRTNANDASVVRKMYLSIDPIVLARSPQCENLEQAGGRDPGNLESVTPSPSPIGTRTHYHPFDRSTKWPSHGTFAVGLIIRRMWRRRHVGAWQRSGGQAIVGARVRAAV